MSEHLRTPPNTSEHLRTPPNTSDMRNNYNNNDNNNNNNSVTFRLKPDMVARLKVICDRHGLTMTDLVTEALTWLIEEEGKTATAHPKAAAIFKT